MMSVNLNIKNVSVEMGKKGVFGTQATLLR